MAAAQNLSSPAVAGKIIFAYFLVQFLKVNVSMLVVFSRNEMQEMLSVMALQRPAEAVLLVQPVPYLKFNTGVFKNMQHLHRM